MENRHYKSSEEEDNIQLDGDDDESALVVMAERCFIHGMRWCISI
jgi:hypothetical protein